MDPPLLLQTAAPHLRAGAGKEPSSVVPGRKVADARLDPVAGSGRLWRGPTGARQSGELGFTLPEQGLPSLLGRGDGLVCKARPSVRRRAVQQQKGWQGNPLADQGLEKDLALLLLCPGPVASPARPKGRRSLCGDTEKKSRRINQSVTAKCFS